MREWSRAGRWVLHGWSDRGGGRRGGWVVGGTGSGPGTHGGEGGGAAWLAVSCTADSRRSCLPGAAPTACCTVRAVRCHAPADRPAPPAAGAWLTSYECRVCPLLQQVQAVSVRQRCGRVEGARRGPGPHPAPQGGRAPPPGRDLSLPSLCARRLVAAAVLLRDGPTAGAAQSL